MEPIDAVADMIIEAKKAVVFTGAGFSTESGIPDFRSPGGVWDHFDSSQLNYPNFMRSEAIREEYWRMHKMMWETIRDARPNSGHYAVAELHRMGRLDCVITQNTDGLHQKAGVPDELVLELHGTMQWVGCLDCGQKYPRALVHDKMRLSILSALAVEDRVPFVTLKELLGATDGNLSVHARKLEEGKLIRLHKSGSGSTSRTEYAITARGRRALETYLQHLEEVIAAVRRAR